VSWCCEITLFWLALLRGFLGVKWDVSLSCSFAQLPFMNDYRSYFISMHSFLESNSGGGGGARGHGAGGCWLAGWLEELHALLKKKFVGGGGKELWHGWNLGKVANHKLRGRTGETWKCKVDCIILLPDRSRANIFCGFFSNSTGNFFIIYKLE